MIRQKNRLAGKIALAASAAMLAVALPSSVFAIGLLSSDDHSVESSGRFAFTPALADPAVAEMIAGQSAASAQMIRFTPASVVSQGTERSVTVAVRVDRQSAQALSARTIAPAETRRSSLELAPTRYNLGLARGFGSFAQAPAARTPNISAALSEANIPDLSDFSPRGSGRDEPSRFAARVELDEGSRVAGRTEDARNSVSDQLVDLGGSYRLSRNLDITAGVRLEQDRDIVPLPDVEQQDSQAVYIGTQFRF